MSDEHPKVTTVMPETAKRDADPAKTELGQETNSAAKSAESVTVETDSNAGDAARLDSRVQAHIGRLLRARYQVLLDEPMPDHLRLCLEALAKKEEGS